jgi:hypothetical protein
MRSLVWMVAIALGACAGSKPPEIDANPNGPACSGQLYDLCYTEHDCPNGSCHNFTGDGFMVCTTGCAPGDDTACTAPGGQAGTCNAMGLCKPAAPNTCHL